MKKFFNTELFLVILSGILMALPWYERIPSYSIFFGLVPMFMAYDRLQEKEVGYWKTIRLIYLGFFVWNALATWWLCNATVVGAIAAFFANSLLMTLVFSVFHFVRKYAGKTVGAFAFITLWLAWEKFFHYTEISWPWLTLGNALGNHPMVIQWYEYTGVLGGSLWILVVNFFIISQVTAWKEKIYGRIAWFFLDVLLFFTIPFVISLYIYFNYEEKPNPVNVMVVQPNIDPYNEKFSGLTYEQQLDIMVNIASEYTDSLTDYVVCPESAIDTRIWENMMVKNPSILQIKKFVDEHPRVKWITGLISHKRYLPGEPISPTARKFMDAPFYYDNFNSAVQIDTSMKLPIYHKSKLVIGVEMTPYPKFFKFLEKFSIDLGGVTGNFGTQPTRGVFRSPDNRFGVGPIICYESVYGKYVSDYIKNGANLLFVITNDGWWGNTPGYHQHLSFSRIRAIEMRRSIARSANTGISALINQRGDLVDTLGWWKRGAIKGTINANDKVTYYANHGDYIGNISAFLALLSLAVAISKYLRRDKSIG